MLEQDPTAGEQADEGSTVTLSVSSGPGVANSARRGADRARCHREASTGRFQGRAEAAVLRGRHGRARDWDRSQAGDEARAGPGRDAARLEGLEPGRRPVRAQSPAGRRRGGDRGRGAARERRDRDLRRARGNRVRAGPGSRGCGQSWLRGDDYRFHRPGGGCGPKRDRGHPTGGRRSGPRDSRWT